jgi:hypothetical protein
METKETKRFNRNPPARPVVINSLAHLVEKKEVKVEKPIPKPIEKPVEKPVPKPIEKPIKEPAEKKFEIQKRESKKKFDFAPKKQIIEAPKSEPLKLVPILPFNRNIPIYAHAIKR